MHDDVSISHGEQDDGDRNRRMRVALIAILMLLLLLLAVLGIFFLRVLVPAGSPSGEDVTHETGLTWIRSIYGFGPAEDEQLFKPTSVAIGSGGLIYANDPQRGRIMVFRPDGTFSGLIHTGAGGSGEGMLARPDRLATSSDGDLYVVDSANRKIIVFDAQNGFLREWPISDATGIDVVGDEVYVSAVGRVVVFSLDGELLYEFGERGRGVGPVMDSPLGITADQALVYIADGLNNALKAFDVDGNLEWVTARSGDADPHAEVTSETPPPSNENDQVLVDLPQDVVIDGSDRLIALDAFSFKILVMDKESGEITASYGDVGTEDGLFFYPTGIDYDPARDWFAVADTNNSRIQIVRIDGSGDSLIKAAQRALVSPFRVCLLPLLALLLMLLTAAILRRRRRVREDDVYREMTHDDVSE